MITFEQAKTHVQSSIDYLEQVISYFDSRSYDKIYVLGVSYGAFLTQEYIAQHGLNLVDGFLVSVGRLDMDQEVWTTFSEGNEAIFEYDSNGDYSIQITEKSSSGDRNGNKMTAAVGYNRYTEKLAAFDLTKVSYFSGTKDEFVGKLNNEEIQFFMDKNVSLNIIPNANHNETTARALENLKDIFSIQ